MKNTFQFNLYNTQLFGQYWTVENPKTVIVLIHGMGAHSGRYQHSVIPTLVAHNHAVIALDLYGHGRSKGKRGHCPSYQALLEAIDYCVVKASELFPNTPTLLYGHSLGGNLVLNYTIRQQHNLKGVIATSPFLRLAFQPPKWKVTLGKLFLKIAPSITLPSEIEAAAISSIPLEVKRYQDDPLIHGKISPMYLFPTVDAGIYAIKHAGEIKIPSLLFHGKADRIIDYNGTVEFNNTANFSELHVYENGYHELHHDTYKEEMLQTVVKWLDKH